MDTFQFLLSKNDPVNFLESSNHQEIEIFIKFYMITLWVVKANSTLLIRYAEDALFLSFEFPQRESSCFLLSSKLGKDGILLLLAP